MSASEVDSEWNFRIVENRLVTVKAVNQETRKIAVEDAQTKLLFTADASDAIEIKGIEAKKQYLFTVNVYTSKRLSDVKEDFLGFFEAVDVDQEMEDFIKAFRFYPTKLRFELVEAAEP
ncbi:MAG: hypothetical protein NWE93_10940 [Candidatus Bathyarchaeota archaeon]|nr:hypothetical protein [Candidatus Bathyarchaeota archaeon]